MNGSQINLRRLRYFRAIARHGSFSEAARHLNITQPALTHHIGQMEESLHVKLFERLPRGIRITEAGAALLKRADTILEEVGKAEEEMLALSRKPGSLPRVRLAVTPAVAASMTPAILAVASQHPFKIVIAESRSKEAGQLLERGQADFAIVVFEAALSARSIPLAMDPLVFVSATPPRSPSSTITCHEVGTRPLILPSSRRTLRPRVDRAMAELGIHLDVVAEIDGIDLRKQAVLDGMGDTIASYLNVRRECLSGQLFARRIVDPTLERQIALEYRDGLEGDLVERMAALLKELLTGLLSLA